MNLVDTSGWIEYFFAGPNASFFADPIEKPRELLVPVVCLYEVFKKINVVADEARALQAVAQMREGQLADVTENIALSASLISIHHGLPMADSTIYATARSFRAVTWTQDEDFSGLPDVNYKPARTRASSRRPKGRG
ncbi:MAG: type II toxin-antitoxin system VapC family toxin [Kiritimatiellae bacterium]|nr:type II toxin-antitoxin system VapC family toxin [Kiritimatiellia bacterium]